MRFFATVAFILALSASPLLAAEGEGEGGEALADDSAKVSYMIGLQIGDSLKRLNGDTGLIGVKIDHAIVTKALVDAMDGKERLLTPEQINKVRIDFETKMKGAQANKMKDQASKNEKEGKDFLAANGKKEGVITTNSGLQYEVMAEGKGDAPKATDTVSVHYKGTLIDGTEFDSSFKRGQPATFPLNGVIRGWTEGVQLMKVGSKFRFFIPHFLAYGARGAGPLIGPNTTLIFEVELLEIKK